MDKLYTRKINILTLRKDSIGDAEIIFDEFVGQKVIKETCLFGDDVWNTTDESQNVGLHFRFDEDSYDKHWEDFFGMELTDVVVYLKSFIMTIMGENALSSIRSLVLDVRHIIAATPEMLENAAESVIISIPDLTSDFFSLMQCRNSEKIICWLDVYADRNYKNRTGCQRTLADIDTYFVFDEKIREFWKSEISDVDRLFYYPLYIWWILTAVIPQRPKEFLLTERDCLTQREDGSFDLRLRYNKLKGSDKKITYKIETDYGVDVYNIPSYLGKEIQRYIDLTEEYEPNELGTLFVSDPHYRKFGKSRHKDSRYLTYANMRTIMRCFYYEILEGVYGLEVYYRYEPKHLRQGDICYIQLGDTRHISLISIMQQGGTVAAAMFLAGHDNTNSASHYYSNMMLLTHSRTYIRYNNLLSGNNKKHIIKDRYMPVRGEGIPLSSGGRCYSEHYKNHDFSDCENTIGPDGELAHCTSCKYYRSKGTSYFSGDDIYSRRIEDDCVALEQAVDLVRKKKGCLEDIGEVVLKLNTDTDSYAQYLLEKEMENGKKGTSK